MKQSVSLVRTGYCQSCKHRLDYDLLQEGVKLRFCTKCKASEYFDLTHFVKKNEQLFIRLNGELWSLNLSDEWGFAATDSEIIELGFGFEDIKKVVKTSRS